MTPSIIRIPLAKPPLATTYRLINSWWRTTLKKPFCPDFRVRDYLSDDTESERMDLVNPAARLFILIAREVDPHYTIDHCRKVDEENYKGLDKKLE